MTQDRLKAIRERVGKATSGPWECRNHGNHIRIQVDGDASMQVARTHGNSLGDIQDARLIANAPSDLVYLLADNDALRARLAQAETLLKPFATVGTMSSRERSDAVAAYFTHPEGE